MTYAFIYFFSLKTSFDWFKGLMGGISGDALSAPFGTCGNLQLSFSGLEKFWPKQQYTKIYVFEEVAVSYNYGL